MSDENVGGLVIQWRHNAQGCGRGDAQAAATWRSCARQLEAALSAHGQPPPRVTQEMANSLHETAQLLDEVDRRSEARREKYGLHGQPVVDEAAQEAIADILNRMESWSKAYPVEVFHEPTKEERDWLHKTRPGLMDCIAASMGRHMAKRIADDLAKLTAALTPLQEPTMSIDHGKVLALADRVSMLRVEEGCISDIEERDAIERELRALAQPAGAVEGDAYEVREDGKRVRKDRWETGFRNIVTVLFGPRTEFEIDDVVEHVRSLANQAHDAAQGAVATFTVTEANEGDQFPDGPLRFTTEGQELRPGTYSFYTRPQAAPAHGDDKALLDALASEYWRLDPFDMPTPGGDDADVGWRVIQYHRGAPRERVVAEVYNDDPRAAIREAIRAAAPSPEPRS